MEKPETLAIEIAAGIEAKLRRLYYETPERAIRDNPMMFMLAMRGLYEEAKELSGLLAIAQATPLVGTVKAPPLVAPVKKKKAPPVPKPEKDNEFLP